MKEQQKTKDKRNFQNERKKNDKTKITNYIRFELQRLIAAGSEMSADNRSAHRLARSKTNSDLFLHLPKLKAPSSRHNAI